MSRRSAARAAHGPGSASGGLRGRFAVAASSVVYGRGRFAARVYLSSPAAPRPLAGWTRSRVRCGTASQARPPRPSSPVCVGGARPVRRRVGRSRVGLLQPAPGTTPHAPPLGSDRPRLMLRPASEYLRRTGSEYLASQHKSGYRTPRSSPRTARPGRGGAAPPPPVLAGYGSARPRRDGGSAPGSGLRSPTRPRHAPAAVGPPRWGSVLRPYRGSHLRPYRG